MVTQRVLVIILVIAITGITITSAFASSGGKDGYSGNPATKGGAICNVCHTGGVVPTVTLSGPSTVSPSETNTYTLTITGGQQIGGGLDVSVTDGTLVVTDAAGTKIKKGELVHNGVKDADVNGTVSWSFNWTAPATEGTVIMYGAGASVNINGNTSGDEANNDTLTITVQAGPPPLQPPVASFTFSPGSPLVGETVNFNASASSDPDGTIVSYSWDFGDGNVSSGVTATNIYVAVGTYNVTLTVFDNDGLNDTASQLVTVYQKPVASFIFTPSSPIAGQTVTFNASASSDIDGTIVSYSWDFGDGNIGSGVTDTNAYASAGTYNVTLTVIDNDGLSDTAWQLVTVSQAPPVASFFFSPSSPETGQTVTFNASASSDIDGTIVSYSWDFGDGNVSSGVTTTNIFVTAGNYTVTLTVTDNDGLNDTDVQVVEVFESAPPPEPPVASFTFNPASPLVGETVNFNASASSDPDGTIVSYSWDFGDGNVSSGVTSNNIYVAVGTYNVTLTVFDNDGLNDTASQLVTVYQKPIASFTFNPASPLVGESVAFNASSSSDPDGTIVSYSWDFDDGNIGSGVIDTNVFASAGTYNVTLTVTDNDGLSDTAWQLVTVYQKPVASFTFNPSSPVAGATVTFDASASSDADGTIVSYSWDFGDSSFGSGVIDTNIYLSAGNYTVTLTVIDNDGLNDTATQNITVSAAPPPPPISVDVELFEHGGGSNCYICHVKGYAASYNASLLHGLKREDVRSSCGSDAGCHQALNNTLLQRSVHAQINCVGCHAPLHVSLQESGAAAWLFVNLLNNTDAPSYKPSLPVSFRRAVYLYDNNNDTTALGADIDTWGGEVHWAWTTLNDGGITSTTRYLVCFNCHFITRNPAEAGLSRLVEGRVMVGIPEFTLELSAHSITEAALHEAFDASNRFVVLKPDTVRVLSEIIGIVIMSVVGIGIIRFVVRRKIQFSF